MADVVCSEFSAVGVGGYVEAKFYVDDVTGIVQRVEYVNPTSQPAACVLTVKNRDLVQTLPANTPPTSRDLSGLRYTMVSTTVLLKGGGSVVVWSMQPGDAYGWQYPAA